MAFAASGGLLLLPSPSTLQSDGLTGDDGWFLPEAPADTWYTAQMGK